MVGGTVTAGLAVFYGYLCLRLCRRKNLRRFPVTKDLYAPFEELLRWMRADERSLPALQRVRMALTVLEGGACTPERLMRWAAEAIGMAYGGCLGCWLLSVLAGNLQAAVAGSVIALCIPALRFKDLIRRVTQRRHAIVTELPVMLSRLLVMVGAGENVMRALNRSAEGRLSQADHPLYRELDAALAAMRRGESVHLAMEEFGRRCAVPEAKLLAATLLMNARRGGEEFVPALRELTRHMWESRKAAAKSLGEQASSRLAFPLAAIFLIIVVLVGAPALMMM